MAGHRVDDIAAVEQALIDCHELWRRSPGAGRWPFAGDGPWHLIQGEDGDYAGDGADGVSSSARPRTPLDAGEVGERDRVTAWLQLLDDPADRAIVWRASMDLWRGEPSPQWRAMMRAIRWDRSDRALAARYPRALAMILCRLNGWPIRRAKALAEAYSREIACSACSEIV